MVYVKQDVRLYNILLSRDWLLDVYSLIVWALKISQKLSFSYFASHQSGSTITMCGAINAYVGLYLRDLTHNGTRTRPFPREAQDHEDKVLISCLSRAFSRQHFYMANTIYQTKVYAPTVLVREWQIQVHLVFFVLNNGCALICFIV